MEVKVLLGSQDGVTLSQAREDFIESGRDEVGSRAQQPIISASGVTKRFVRKGSKVEAVRDVTIDVFPGEFVALVGPSGCGKSTLLNMTAGLMAPSGGALSFNGGPVPSPNRNVGYMTQKDSLLPWLTVADNIGLALKIRGVPKAERNARVQEMIELVGLTGFERSYPSELSGGMRKRAMLARTLIYAPEVLLADEPFAALDAQLKMVMQQELLRICYNRNLTVVFVTHDISEAITIADRVVVFTKGPGQIKLDVKIEIPHPRNVYTVRTNPTYVHLEEQLWLSLGQGTAASAQERAPK